MKFATIVLAIAGLLLTQTFAAPSTEPKSEVNEASEDSRITTDTTSSLSAANEGGKDSNREKKSSGPKTICYEVKDEGISYLQCVDEHDSESAGSSMYPSYSPAPSSSYGSAPSSYGSAPSYAPSYSAPSYKVNSLSFINATFCEKNFF